MGKVIGLVAEPKKVEEPKKEVKAEPKKKSDKKDK